MDQGILVCGVRLGAFCALHFFALNGVQVILVFLPPSQGRGRLATQPAEQTGAI